MSSEDVVDKSDHLSLGPAEVFEASEVDKELKDDEDLNVLSEEQTNAALAALEDHVDVVDSELSEALKRKAEVDLVEHHPPAKARRTTTRVPWEDRIQMLKEYKETHGDLLIPIRYKEIPSLGKFVHNMREQYKLFHKTAPVGYKKKCSLTAERIIQLEGLGFVWTTNREQRHSSDWNDRLKQLEDYKKKHGDCMVPHGYKDDPSFAEWIHRQRTAYAAMLKQENPSKMVKERMEKLEALDFNFTVHRDKWISFWQELKEYKDKHGHCQVPTHYTENPKLGRWVHTQRHQRRELHKGKGKKGLTEERIKMLDDLEFAWEVKPGLDRPRATWQQRYRELLDFHRKHHHFCVPVEEAPLLHIWTLEQKNRLRNVDKNKGKDFTKRMGPDRVKLLKEIGFTASTPLNGKDRVALDENRSLEDARSWTDDNQDANAKLQLSGESATSEVALGGTSTDSVVGDMKPAPVPNESLDNSHPSDMVLVDTV